MFKRSALLALAAVLLALARPSHSEAGWTFGPARPPIVVVKADLVITYAKRWGDVIWVRVKNQGLVTAQTVAVRHRDSTAFAYGLAAGQSEWFVFGTWIGYYVGMIEVDPADCVDESNEDNNIAWYYY